MKDSIKEIIVVEGKEDVRAVKNAVNADLICTNGLGLTKETIKEIENAQKKCGVIIFTDPDFPGEKIRSLINQAVQGCKNAYLPKAKAKNIKKHEIGIEHASPQDIIQALKNAKAELKDKIDEFTLNDLVQLGLVGGEKANTLRVKLGEILGIGETNGKQFLNRLNWYGVSKEEIVNILEGLIEEGIYNDRG